MKDYIEARMRDTVKTLEATLAQSDVVVKMAERLIDCVRGGGKVLVCGNGGSAADAQHIAAELVGRLARERRAIPAIALTTNSSILTAIGNDYGYEHIFARQVEALASKGDVLIAISTSGNAANVLAAVDAARTLGCHTLALTGGTGGKLKSAADLALVAPSNKTWHIQEVHITVGHILCDLVEKSITDE